MAKACLGLKSPRKDDIMQDAAKRMRRVASVLSLETMSDDSLRRAVESAFKDSQNAVLGLDLSGPGSS
jgi:hypothetical protein